MRVLYVTHNGIGTALVRSQVLPYMRILETEGHEIDLLTFERGVPYPDGEFRREKHHPLRPRSGRSLVAKVTDILVGTAAVAAVVRRRRIQVLHARSYLPAAICSLVARAFGVKFIFDMRGFLGEEYVDAGTWTSSDLRYRALRLAERWLVRSADEIVVLTHAAARWLHSREPYASDIRSTRITVIPCAVDIQRFRPLDVRSERPTLVYAGSVGTWYALNEMIHVYGLARREIPGLRFLFLNRDEHETVSQAWSRAGLPRDRLDLRAVDFAHIPDVLGRAHVGIALIRPTPSKLGSSPIKVAEYLACGLPVLVNEGVGDLAEQVRSAGAGYVVTSFDEAALARASKAIGELWRDEGARKRARKLATAVFDLRAGAAAYGQIYHRLAGGNA